MVVGGHVSSFWRGCGHENNPKNKPLGATWEAPVAPGRHVGATRELLGGPWEPPGRHLEPLGATWEPLRSHLGA